MSIKSQSAALFVVLAILIVAGRLQVAGAVGTSDKLFREQSTLQTWRFESARVDALARSTISDTELWNKALRLSDSQDALLLEQQLVAEGASINGLIGLIAALQLPAHADPIRKSHAIAAFVLTSFASTFVAAGVHSDADTSVAIIAARNAWTNATKEVDPFINAALVDNATLVSASTTSTFVAVTVGGLLLLIVVFLLGWLQFRLTLRPVTRLAQIAGSLAAGRPATIEATNRNDEIGRLTGALLAWQQTLTGDLFQLRGNVADAATTLSAAAQELAAATSVQTTAATATSASMEELARISSAVAETVDRVANQAAQTQTNLELAQSDLKASGDRTLALAGRINEIEGILQLIDDIADLTNMLALNAAIEAARAGDAGRGFAVVADEVRRLAERSKSAAGQIAALVEGAQAQSTETVMALDKGVRQMEHGLSMMKAMAGLSTQVQRSTTEQRSATAQVMEAIEHIVEGSRSISMTAVDLAAAASSQGELAADLVRPSRVSKPAVLEPPIQLRRLA